MTAPATDYAKARETMVEQQVRPWDVLDTRVLEVLNTVPRDAFVPDVYRALAYADLQVPIGHGEVDAQAGGRRPDAAGAGAVADR